MTEKKTMKVLVTGGAGYIGSHVVAELFRAGHEAIILDDFSNSEEAYLDNIHDVVNREVTCIKGNFSNRQLLQDTLSECDIDGVIHFAAFKYVGESVELPLKYFRNNVSGFIELLDVVANRDIPIIFSSSAAIYGEPSTDKVAEDEPAKPMNAYGASKLMDEQILEAAAQAKQPARGIALRYFNAVGADASGKLGETLTPFSQNLWPHVVKAALGETPHLSVFGDDFPTPDGTGMRDYIHVTDLADAHVRSLEFLVTQPAGFYNVYNVGTGVATSVLEFVKTFEKVNGIKVPYKINDRRPGDPAAYYAICDRIQNDIGWKSKLTIEDAIKDAWRWQQSLKN